jgi:hypothetical protein
MSNSKLTKDDKKEVLMLYINKEHNSLVFDSKDFSIKMNYMPIIFMAIRELDKDKPIHFAVELEKTPAIFVLYFKKIKEESDLDFRVYYLENSDILKNILSGYNMKYRPLSDFPDTKRESAIL